MQTESGDKWEKVETYEFSLHSRKIATDDTIDSMWRLTMTAKDREDLVRSIRQLVNPYVK